jgi:hypothetical protein
MEATPDNLLSMALAEIGSGRNNRGHWLAQQLHANGYSKTDAEIVMRQYASSVPQYGDRDPYTEKEAIATLNTEYRKQPLEPWDKSKQSVSMHRDRLSSVRQKMDVKPLKEPRQADIEKIKAMKKLCQGNQSLAGSPAQAYLESRGIPLEVAKECRVKYHPSWPFKCGDDTHRLPAVVFPFFNNKGELVAAQGRVLQPWEGKNQGNRGSFCVGVFGTPGAVACDPIAITEAPIDALSLYVAGCPTIATGGTGNFPDWLEVELAKSPKPGYSRTVFIATDSDGPGEDSAGKIQQRLSYVRPVRLKPVGVKDWNDVLTSSGVDELCNIVDTAYIERGFNPPVRPDPRPELTQDCSLWIRLLRHAESNPELHSVLYNFRGGAARLVRCSVGLRICYQDSDGWSDQASFDADYSRYLEPYSEILRPLLESFTKEA